MHYVFVSLFRLFLSSNTLYKMNGWSDHNRCVTLSKYVASIIGTRKCKHDGHDAATLRYFQATKGYAKVTILAAKKQKDTIHPW